MKIEEFELEIKQLSRINNINFTEEEIEKLYKYMRLMLEWNEKINLTAITNEKEVILKHFIDSAVVNRFLSGYKTLIDVGTGAGFPGMVLKIMNENLEITLLDSLNKRTNFLNEVINQEKLEKIETVHGRAEEYGRNTDFREKYDVVVSRAVANMNVLLEYTMPFLKVGGICICMKSVNALEEINNSKNVIKSLGGELINIENIVLRDDSGDSMERNIVIIKKVEPISDEFPRTSKKIINKSLV